MKIGGVFIPFVQIYHPSLIDRVHRAHVKAIKTIAQQEAYEKARAECEPPAESYFGKFKRAFGFQKEEDKSQSRKLIINKLKQQLDVFREYGVPGFSLFAQISNQFNPQFLAQEGRPFIGMVFICYENVIVERQKANELCEAKKALPLDYSGLYNCTTRDRWLYFLRLLKEKGFLLVLITRGLPTVDEDKIFDTIVNHELKGIFHAKLFTGSLVEKVPLIDHVKQFSQEQGIFFNLSSPIYFFDAQDHIENANAFNIFTFEFNLANQIPEAPFFSHAVSYFEGIRSVKVVSSIALAPALASPLARPSSPVFATPLAPTSPMDVRVPTAAADTSSPLNMISLEELIQQEILDEDRVAVSTDFFRKMGEMSAQENHEFQTIAAAARNDRLAIQRRAAALKALQKKHLQDQQEYFRMILNLKKRLILDAEREMRTYHEGIKGFEPCVEVDDTKDDF